MQCPHCNSLMNLYQKTTNAKSQAAFYRCSLCVAQHVSCSIVTTGQFDRPENQHRSISGHSSHNLTAAIV